MKKRYGSLLLALMMVVTILPVAGVSAEAVLHDSSLVPIGTRAELEAVADNLNGAYYLTADIDLAGDEWTPLAPDYETPFTGIFDGQGYVIRNMTITGDAESAGLFVYARGALFRNIRLEDLQMLEGGQSNS